MRMQQVFAVGVFFPLCVCILSSYRVVFSSAIFFSPSFSIIIHHRISEPMQLIQKHDKKSRQQHQALRETQGGRGSNSNGNGGSGDGDGDVFSDDGTASLYGEDPLLNDVDDGIDRSAGGHLTVLSPELIRAYNRIAKTLVKYETLWHQQWMNSVDGFQEHLHRPLFVRTTMVELHNFQSLEQEQNVQEKKKSKSGDDGKRRRKSKSDARDARDARDGRDGSNDYDDDDADYGPRLGIHGIHVNFDPRLFQLTHEAKHMIRLGYEVPESARFVCEQEIRLKRTYDELNFLLHELHDSMVSILVTREGVTMTMTMTMAM